MLSSSTCPAGVPGRFRASRSMRLLALAAASASSPLAWAQSATTPQQVVITGNPLRDSEVATPTSTLSGDGLVLRRASTLGETLDGLPGVSSSYFGPNANRPVIRGQDGDRIRMLSNAGASLDASSLSYDHAVPIDPLVVERIEVLRGPAALLYGGSAVGGVVNALDNRIPRSPLDGPTGAVETRIGGAADERGASALVETGFTTGLTVHADAFWRETSDLHVPDFEHPGEDGPAVRDRVVNSASRADGGAIGASMAWDKGYIGASIDTYRNTYGTVAEEEVTIQMKRDKFALAGEVRDLDGPIRTIRGQLSSSTYQHIEFEGAEVGTTFKNRGVDSRLELEHRPLDLGSWSLRGVLGAQTEQSRFSALGAEAFVPSTRSTQFAGFAYEELKGPAGKITLGARLERAKVESAGDDAAAETPRFGSATSRSFSPKSLALGGLWQVAPQWQLMGNFAYTERAPTFYELFADGLHIATASYERGNPALSPEKGRNIDIAAQWKPTPDSHSHLKLGVFASRFANYIALLGTGESFIDDETGKALPVYAYTGVSARLSGIEIEGAWRAIDGGNPLDIDAKLDTVRATNADSNQPLPRIAPMRATLGVDWSIAQWATRVEVVHAAKQNRVPADDPPTDAYTLLNLSTSRKFDLGGLDALFFLKLNNLTNELAYNAATISTVRVLSPLPGRGLAAGLRVVF